MPSDRSAKPAFMMLRINILIPTLILSFLSAESQKLNKTDKITLANLQAHVRYLSDDKLEGRRMGAPGEKAAGDYIISELSKAGVRPKGDNNGWLQAFTIDQGREISADAYFTVDDQPLLLNREWFPLALSPAGQITGSPAIALQESGVPWFLDLKELLEAGAGSHFDLSGAIRAKAASCAKKGATALILFNSSSRYPDKLSFDPKDRPQAAVIPVLYLTREAKRKYLKDESASVDLRIRIGFTERQRTGHNVVGYLDNGAATTVIIGAHYDHLGRGEDSAAVNPPPPSVGKVVYNGANDNASGVAAMLELGRLLGASKLRNNNYLFIAFSGSELGWFGSGYFAGHPVIDLKKSNYMIDMEMIGRLNDTTHTLTIGGYRTSPVWVPLCNSLRDKKSFTFLYDSSSKGDYAAFYQKEIPALFFSTGPYPDYHQPGDDYDKINYPGELQILKFIYSLIEEANTRGRVAFAP
jgi:hypothetical protein